MVKPSTLMLGSVTAVTGHTIITKPFVPTIATLTTVSIAARSPAPELYRPKTPEDDNAFAPGGSVDAATAARFQAVLIQAADESLARAQEALKTADDEMDQLQQLSTELEALEDIKATGPFGKRDGPEAGCLHTKYDALENDAHKHIAEAAARLVELNKKLDGLNEIYAHIDPYLAEQIQKFYKNTDQFDHSQTRDWLDNTFDSMTKTSAQIAWGFDIAQCKIVDLLNIDKVIPGLPYPPSVESRIKAAKEDSLRVAEKAKKLQEQKEKLKNKDKKKEDDGKDKLAVRSDTEEHTMGSGGETVEDVASKEIWSWFSGPEDEVKNSHEKREGLSSGELRLLKEGLAGPLKKFPDELRKTTDKEVAYLETKLFKVLQQAHHAAGKDDKKRSPSRKEKEEIYKHWGEEIERFGESVKIKAMRTANAKLTNAMKRLVEETSNQDG